MCNKEFVCDVCGEPFTADKPARVEWLTRPDGDRRVGRGLRLAHAHGSHGGCQYNSMAEFRRDGSVLLDRDLGRCLGPDGLTELLALLDDGVLPSEDVLAMIRRLHPHVDIRPGDTGTAIMTSHVPGYRQALRPELQEILKAMRPSGAEADQPVFRAVLDVAGGHKIRRFQRDLKAAGIPYRDAQGRTADFHALSRMTPNTHMGQMGVGERVRQEFMRHSDLRLTSAVYTDAGQLPTAGAIRALPSFTADGIRQKTHKDAQRDAQNSDKGGPDEAQQDMIDYSI